MSEVGSMLMVVGGAILLIVSIASIVFPRMAWGPKWITVCAIVTAVAAIVVGLVNLLTRPTG